MLFRNALYATFHHLTPRPISDVGSRVPVHDSSREKKACSSSVQGFQTLFWIEGLHTLFVLGLGFTNSSARSMGEPVYKVFCTQHALGVYKVFCTLHGRPSLAKSRDVYDPYHSYTMYVIRVGLTTPHLGLVLGLPIPLIFHLEGEGMYHETSHFFPLNSPSVLHMRHIGHMHGSGITEQATEMACDCIGDLRMSLCPSARGKHVSFLSMVHIHSPSWSQHLFP